MGVVQDDWSCTRISSQICLTFIPHSFNCSLAFLLLLSYRSLTFVLACSYFGRSQIASLIRLVLG
jgi:hypothetical protein